VWKIASEDLEQAPLLGFHPYSETWLITWKKNAQMFFILWVSSNYLDDLVA